ncbi:hypothetical protein BD830_105239 [Maritimibacter alkaliphilus HTCC2654]|uniref:Uncharacterized protein n=1 Tax=Maritimibacter alkaliphilus HTCC2654 TaxID=314271 RepID=A3VLE5_9RHOB|nr:hypothetical protein [Maritimibacter alkaliphilus]EAQ10950.1 hypothetical protein RB2654_04984 [Rhodobacterales bacterium HTCC2654] [Maritimibacter alkaliphilus HTCC2654]TYP81572.1 hypothetical protein BD830_105239 [Maritimibacter alkaliphilus HTCC2654]
MSDDDKNSEMMDKFIASATPKLLEAMQEQIGKMVEDQIGGLKEASQKMLDEIKDHKRERDEAAAAQKAGFDQLKTLLERGDEPRAVHDALNPEPVVLTREQARDPALYRRAKAAAEQQGVALKIAADG